MCTSTTTTAALALAHDDPAVDLLARLGATDRAQQAELRATLAPLLLLLLRDHARWPRGDDTSKLSDILALKLGSARALARERGARWREHRGDGAAACGGLRRRWHRSEVDLAVAAPVEALYERRRAPRASTEAATSPAAVEDSAFPSTSRRPSSAAASRASLVAASEFASAGFQTCLLYTSPSPRDGLLSRMPSSA